jgi:hypothetical protein
LLLELEERGNNNQNIVLLNCRINKEEWEKIVETQEQRFEKNCREKLIVFGREERESVFLYILFFSTISAFHYK